MVDNSFIAVIIKTTKSDKIFVILFAFIMVTKFFKKYL